MEWVSLQTANMWNVRLLATALLAILIMSGAQATDDTAGNCQYERLWQSFVSPPDSIKVGCYYYWVNEQVDPVGVRKDLRWMKDNGITLAFLATDIRNRTRWDDPWAGQTFGKNKFQSRHQRHHPACRHFPAWR